MLTPIWFVGGSHLWAQSRMEGNNLLRIQRLRQEWIWQVATIREDDDRLTG